MVPVRNESIFRRQSALCENDKDKISVIKTDLRFADERVWTIEGMTATGNSNKEGVFHDIEKTAVTVEGQHHFK